LENRTVSEEKNKPVLDEQTLAKLLEAAFVLQEHNRELRELELCMELKREQVEAEDRNHSAQNPLAPARKPSDTAPPYDYTLTLGKIVETQHHIQVRRLELEDALKLVAERVLEMGSATGAAVGTIDGKTVRYRAVAGRGTPPSRSIVPVAKSMFVPCLKTGQVFRCSDVTSEFLLDADECKRRGIQSLIAVPIFHDGGVAGGLELYYDSADAFTEQEVHTCQLMAGLVTEALARDEEATWKKSLANERAAMLEALEKLQPNLAALVERPAVRNVSASVPEPAATRHFSCRKCGHQLMSEEQFCGQCGTPRAGDYEPPSMQSKVASLWHMQESQKKESATEGPKSAANNAESAGAVHPEFSRADALQQQVPDLFTTTDLELSDVEATELPALQSAEQMRGVEDEEISGDAEEEAGDEPGASQALVKPTLTHPADWSSAATAREFLEQLASGNQPGGLVRFWNTRRGDVYLAIAVVLVACVIRWGIWSDHSIKASGSPETTATTQRKPAPDAGLPFFDRMLIQLGLAEAPQTPEDRGSPGVQVWVDLHTALYYCPGTDLYGKTSKGKFTTQREAQLDQFEPAYRKTCN
jgi:hypothetical protein